MPRSLMATMVAAWRSDHITIVAPMPTSGLALRVFAATRFCKLPFRAVVTPWDVFAKIENSNGVNDCFRFRVLCSALR